MTGYSGLIPGEVNAAHPFDASRCTTSSRKYCLTQLNLVKPDSLSRDIAVHDTRQQADDRIDLEHDTESAAPFKPCLLFARRRVGRGGRLMFDRISSFLHNNNSNEESEEEEDDMLLSGNDNIDPQ